MIHFKSRRIGLTLLEVMAALVIISFTLLPLFNAFTRIMERIEKISQSYDYLLLGKNFLQGHTDRTATDIIIDQKNDEHNALIHYVRSPIAKDSSLAEFENVCKEQVTVSWVDEYYGRREETMISFVCVQPEDKKVPS